MAGISKRTQYALRVLLALARCYGTGPIRIRTLAKAEAIPTKFLEQILRSLRGVGLTDSRAGRYGGYWLAQPPRSISLGTILRVMEGSLAPLPCLERRRTCDSCTSVETCATRTILYDVHIAMAQVLDNTTLEQACQRADAIRPVELQPVHYSLLTGFQGGRS